MLSIVLALFAAVASILLTASVRSNAAHLGLVSEPNQRSAHAVLIPHGGGIGFVVPILLISCLSLFFYNVSTDVYLPFVLGGIIIAAVSLWDDLHQLSSLARLGVHLAAAFGFVGSVLWSTYTSMALPQAPLLMAVATILLAWWINLFNFMDGIDSIAGIECITLLLGYLALASTGGGLALSDWFTMTALVMIASVLGFLFHNWPPASIFMGDVGSAFLGFATGALALTGWTLGKAPLWSWLILAGVFFVDATYTLLRRLLSGERWWQAHNSHAYQNLSRYFANRVGDARQGRAFAHRRVAVGTGLINIIWLLPMALLAQQLPGYGPYILIAAWLPLLLVVARWSRVSHPISSTK